MHYLSLARLLYFRMSMGEKSLNWRIITAALFSAVLVVGAYLLAKGVGSPPVAQASAETALLQAIATRDSNGDGLPDWQKALYGIPLTATTTDYFNLGMTDGEAVAKGLIVPKAVADFAIATSTPGASIIDPSLPPAPAEGTLTAAFAKTFFTLYLNAKQANGGIELSQTQIDNLADQTLNSLSSLAVVAPDYKSANDLTVSGTGAEALKAFAANVEAVFSKNTSDATKNEILYLSDVLQNNDTSAFPHLISIAKMYRDSAAGLAVLSVPQELAAADLTLINALMRESEITSDFARVNTDPLAAMLALQQYQQVGQSFIQAFTGVNDTYVGAGVTSSMGAPGAAFINTAAIIAARQQTAAILP